ncbi:MAG: hypothetical protein AAB875_07275, partial [Patescibacteria group bacterium]
RRTILEIINGQLSVKNMKILKVKKGEGPQLLGNHWHPESQEVMCILKGSCKRYIMENLDTGEKEEYCLEEGDVIIRTSRIVHAGIFDEDCWVLDGATEVYMSADLNDIQKVILTK